MTQRIPPCPLSLTRRLTWMLPILLVLPWIEDGDRGRVVAQENPAPAAGVTQGRLGTLPGVEGATASSDALGGHFRLLEKTIDRAISDLQNGDLRAFVVSYKQMVESYVQLADQAP